jgi:hypothetical protein
MHVWLTQGLRYIQDTARPVPVRLRMDSPMEDMDPATGPPEDRQASRSRTYLDRQNHQVETKQEAPPVDTVPS